MKLYIVSSALVLLSSAAPFVSAELTGRNRRLNWGDASTVTTDDITEDSTQFYGGYTPYWWQRNNGTPYWQRDNGTPYWEQNNGRSWSSGWNYDPPVLDAMVSNYDIEAVAYGDYGRGEGEEYDDYENNPGFRHQYKNQGYVNEGDEYGRSSYEHSPGYKQYKNIMNNKGFPEAEELVTVSSSYGPHSYRNNEGYKHRAHHYGGGGGGHSGHHGGGGICQNIHVRDTCKRTHGCMWEGARGFCTAAY